MDVFTYMECKWGLSVTAVERVESETWDTFEHSCLLLALADTARTLVLPLSVFVRTCIQFSRAGPIIGPGQKSAQFKALVHPSPPAVNVIKELFHWPSNFVIRHYWIRNRAWSKLSFCISIDTRTCSTMLIRFFHRKGGKVIQHCKWKRSTVS